MKQVRFEEQEMPYEVLGRYGLTREMIEDLPLFALEDIGHGRRSPVLPIRVTGEDGQAVKSRTRFALVRLDDGKTDVVFYPVLKVSPLERYSEEQQKQLAEGKAVLARVDTAEGRQKMFVQIDPGTRQVMSVPTPVIGRNLQVLADELRLGTAEIRSIQNGEPLTIILDDEAVTVGIDLNDRTGLRFCDGDSRKWKEQAKREWDRYTFGCYGCWVTDADGNLDYVPEEQYTDELWNEQKKSAERHAASLRK